MRLSGQVIHIYRTFGLAHAARRVFDALRAKLNEFSRNSQHKRRVRRLRGQDKLVINCLGKDFELRVDDFGLYRDLISDRIREPVATSLMLKYARPEFTVLDAGANIGYFSLLLADRCKAVYAVEPDMDNFNALVSNIRRNAVENIRTFNMAFSDKSELLRLNKSSRANWHTTSKIGDDDSSGTIHARTIDDFCQEHGFYPDIIKMDIEGFERFVIPGAASVLKYVKYLFFELHSTHMGIGEVNSLLDVIERSGLKITNIIRYDRPALWIEEPLEILWNIRKGDFGIYELIYSREPQVAHD